MSVFDSLDVWLDDTPRSGAENMAVDQLMMERVGDRPMLRIYEWSEPTVTFGYFLPLTDAAQSFPGDELTYVRRWTGGGVVDHRVDSTYTLAIPRAHPLASARGAESYRVIHQALADALDAAGESVRLTVVDEGDGGSACFTNPVAYDLTNSAGQKVAGAGQRRSRYGLLHQGSVISNIHQSTLADALIHQLSQSVTPWTSTPSWFSEVSSLAARRYASDEWLRKIP